MVFALFNLFNAHPHPYNWSKIEKKLEDGLPAVISYHIHCVFVLGDANAVREALTLRDQFILKFNLSNTTLCTDNDYNDNMCMFAPILKPFQESPWISGNWAAYIPISEFAPTVQWIMQRRGDLSILVHGNSRDELSDHLNWELWGGLKWPINTSALQNKTLV